MQIISVLLPLPFDQAFYYSLPLADTAAPTTSIKAGQFVTVEFRRKKLIGIIWEEAQPKDLLRPDMKLKPVLQIFDLPLLSQSLISFIRQVASYNLIPLGSVLKMVLGTPGTLESLGKYKIEKSHDPALTANESPSRILLSAAQRQATDNISARMEQYNTTLLDGVTGSGKTEVYCSIIEKVVQQGAQALVLLPEIVLSTQLFNRLKQKLNKYHFTQWHSSVTPKNKKIAWQAVLQGSTQVVVGARSALFLPFQQLKLIIVDEEQDSSFKQEEGAIYNARDMAVLRASLENIPVILASATPSIETIYNTKTNKYHYEHLPERFSGVPMPHIQIVDMNQQPLKKQQWISDPLRSALRKTLEEEKQSIIFLNRRGYAPITVCCRCKSKAECPNCRFWLVLHRAKNLLQCHYCGYKTQNTNLCSNCHSTEHILAYGPGIERIAEEVHSFLPAANIAVLTSDTIQDHKDAAMVIDKIQNQEIDIIIGTQIVAKGLHFKNLHLVGVIDADCNYTGSDLRALEKTYQLLHQVAGRAGREQTRGLVLMQSYNPSNIVLHNLASGSRECFIDSEIADRLNAKMPPFSRLALITAASANEPQLLKFMTDMARCAPSLPSLQVFGPSPAPLLMLRSKYRHRFILKAEKNLPLQKIIRDWQQKIPAPSHVTIKVDIDPYNFL